MENNSQHISLPLEALFQQLETAGFVLDTSRKLRAWRLLNATAGRHMGDLNALMHLLCPLFARTLQEQKRFEIIFEQFWVESVKEWEQWESHTSTPPVQKTTNIVNSKPPKNRAYNLFFSIVGIAVIGLLLFVVWDWLNAEKAIAPKASIELILPVHGVPHAEKVHEGDSVKLGNKSSHFDSTKVNWKVVNTQNLMTLSQDSSQSPVWIAPKAGTKFVIELKVSAKPVPRLPKDTSLWDDTLFSVQKINSIVHCTNPPKSSEIHCDQAVFISGVLYTFNIEKEDNCGVEWEFITPISRKNEQWDDSQNTTKSSHFSYTFSAQGKYEVRAKIYRKNQKEFCYTEHVKSVTVGANRPFLSLAPLKYDYPTKLMKFSLFGWVVAFIPLILAFWMQYLWWQKRKKTVGIKSIEELASEYPIFDEAPFHIPYNSQEDKINKPRDFFKIAEILRRRERAERLDFDAQRSVQATIQAGGFPTWRDKSNTQPVEYLFLIECPEERDQQFRLFERLTEFMVKRDAPITAFFHDGRFERFWARGKSEYSVDFQQLNRQFPRHRLVIWGNGYGLTYDQRILRRDASRQISLWSRRLLFTPTLAADWGSEERSLNKLIPIFPADTDGILRGLGYLDFTEDYLPGSFEYWKESFGKNHLSVQNNHYNKSKLERLQERMAHDGDLWRWCKALAVSAHPDWALTIAIGEALGVEVTHDRLLELSRLDWLRKNESDEYLRLELLKILNSDDERAAREAVATELQQVEEQVKNGFAALEWASNLGVQRFALKPHDSYNKQRIQHLIRFGLLSGGQLEELEWIVEKNRLVVEGKEKLERWLSSKEEDSLLTWNTFWAVALVLGSLFMFISALQYNSKKYIAPPSNNPKTPFHSIYTPYDKTIELNNQAVKLGDSITALKEYSRWVAADSSRLIADTLWKQAITIRKYNIIQRKQPDFEPNWSPNSPLSTEQAELLKLQLGKFSLLDSNLAFFNYNQGVKCLNFYLMDSSGIEALRNAKYFFDKAMAGFGEDRPFIQHGVGLYKYYIKDLSGAKSTYELIRYQDPNFFKNCGMPVNLETLLTEEGQVIPNKNVLRVLVLDANSRLGIGNVSLKLKNLPDILTDAQGRAYLDVLPNSIVNVISATVEKEGYQSWSGRLAISTEGHFDTVFLNAKAPIVKSLPTLDIDNDGIPDTQDACPNQWGPPYTKGCPDTDNDGIADFADKCPDKYGAKENSGCPDTDNDGIADYEDKCPDIPGIRKNAGCPEAEKIPLAVDPFSPSLLEGWDPSAKVVSIGDNIGNARLKNVDGRYLTLFDQFGENGAAIIFLCLHCPYDELYEDRIIQLHKKFSRLGVPVIAINPNSPLILPEDSFENMQKRAKAKKYPFIYLDDGVQQIVYPKFGATRTPHCFLLNKSHEIVYIGAFDDNPEAPQMVKNKYLENAINAMLNGQTPEPDFTRAVGCTIKKKPKE